jgi:hypothetical protein
MSAILDLRPGHTVLTGAIGKNGKSKEYSPESNQLLGYTKVYS